MASEQTTVIPAAGRLASIRFRQVELEVIAGPDIGKKRPIARRELTVGSHPSNDLVLSDSAVSRFHFRIVADDSGYRLLDDTSTNGTFVADLVVRDAYLPAGAQIRVGNSVIALSFGSGDAEIALSVEDHFGDAIGSSVAMREAFALARTAAGSKATVLIRGETGTGKDVLARAIHSHGPRAKHPFVVFDCAAVPTNLIESALFGHIRGSFTGADRDHPGVFRAADGGTLFIDELGELPLELQPKLLRALESGEVTPVGTTEPIAVDVRIVAATHRDLRNMVTRDSFRPDLYYRLAVLTIDLPPLRDRGDDIQVLASLFLRQLIGADDTERLTKLQAHLTESLGSLASYPWPGNVRELRNAVERASVMAEAETLELDVDMGRAASSGSASLRAHLPLPLAREQFDREYLRELMTRHGGSLSEAATSAEIHPKSLARLLRRYKIERNEPGRDD